MTDAFTQILFANLALAVGILAVLALRKPVRTNFGPRLAYALWLLPPLAALASLLPPRIIEIAMPVQQLVDATEVPVSVGFTESIVLPLAPTAAPVATPDPATIALIVWLAGVAVMTLWLAFSQVRFLREMRDGKAGPAVVGFLRPRIVTPADFEDRFDQRERSVIITHETIHLNRQDARVNALVALTRVVFWFNPLVHAGAYYLRIDQELACDATVIERHPNARKSYAGALLKAQLAARPLPLGCYWPASADHPLTERIEMLKHSAPGRTRRIAGAALLAGLASASGLAAWAALPAHQRYVATGLPAIAEPVVQDQPAPAPQPPVEQPTPAPAPMPAPEPTSAFDLNDVLAVQGNIIRVEGDGPMAIVWLQATDIIRNDGQMPNARIWRLETRLPTTPADRLTPGARIRVVGYNAIDKACAPNCRLQVFGWNLSMQGKSRYPIGFAAPPREDDLLFRDLPVIENPQPVPVPMLARATSIRADRITTDAETGDTIYEGNVQIMVGGTIMKTDRVVISPNKDGIEPWGVWERLGADGKAKESMLLAPPDPLAAPAGTFVTISDRREPGDVDRMMPVPQPPGAQARPALLPGEKPGLPFAALFDANAPLTLAGKVTKMELLDPNSFMWVEAEGRLYKVMIPRQRLLPDDMRSAAFIGRSVTVRGYEAKDKTCKPECLINGRDVRTLDANGNAIGWTMGPQGGMALPAPMAAPAPPKPQ